MTGGATAPGRASGEARDVDDAIARIGADIATAGNPARLYMLRGLLHQKRGRFEEALGDLQCAVACDPADAMGYHGLGVLHQSAGQHAAAAGFLGEAVRRDPDSVESAVRLAETLGHLNRHAAAIPLLDHAERLAPARLDIQWMACWARMHACAWKDHAERTGRFLQAAIDAGYPLPPFMILALGRPPLETLLWTRAWAEARSPVSADPLTRYERTADRPRPHRIRVGYLSADFKTHATAGLVTELFLLHDRSRFDLVGYRIGRDDGSAAGRQMAGALDRMVDLTPLGDRAAAQRIAEDGIEILVDLNGYTTDSRSGILAHRPAPIQVSYLGYPGSMGTAAIDYVIADGIVAPVEQQAFYDEAIVHLPHSYQPNDRRRPGGDPRVTRARSGLPEEGFVFCCFNNPYKLTPAMFATWMRLLLAIPRAVLWLLGDGEAVGANLRASAREHGVCPDRLVFAPRTSYEAHLARLPLADLFLDTLPYNAHTTASEALWCGLPVLTCPGPHFPGRVAASLLAAAGLPDLIADDPAAYEQQAVALARDPARLGALRATLLRNRATCPLFDTPRYVRNYEAALGHMVGLRDAGCAPKPFALEEGRP